MSYFLLLQLDSCQRGMRRWTEASEVSAGGGRTQWNESGGKPCRTNEIARGVSRVMNLYGCRRRWTVSAGGGAELETPNPTPSDAHRRAHR